MAGAPKPRIDVEALETDAEGNAVARFSNGVKLVMSNEGDYMFTSLTVKLPIAHTAPDQLRDATPMELNARSPKAIETEWTL